MTKSEAKKFATGFSNTPSDMLRELEKQGIVANWWYRGNNIYTVVWSGGDASVEMTGERVIAFYKQNI